MKDEGYRDLSAMFDSNSPKGAMIRTWTRAGRAQAYYVLHVGGATLLIELVNFTRKGLRAAMLWQPLYSMRRVQFEDVNLQASTVSPPTLVNIFAPMVHIKAPFAGCVIDTAPPPSSLALTTLYNYMVPLHSNVPVSSPQSTHNSTSFSPDSRMWRNACYIYFN
jgi:hypothetical protein